MAKTRKVWTPRKMNSALKQVMKKESGVKIAAKMHSVPVTTLRRYVQQMRSKVYLLIHSITI